MAISKEKTRLWITIHKDTRKTLDLLKPILKRSISEIVDTAITGYAMALIEYSAKQLKNDKKKGK